MGKTFKDQNKYDRKRSRQDNESEMLRAMQKKRNKKHVFDEIIPADDELTPYELLDYDDRK
jgi:hypothetical protein